MGSGRRVAPRVPGGPGLGWMLGRVLLVVVAAALAVPGVEAARGARKRAAALPPVAVAPPGEPITATLPAEAILQVFPPLPGGAGQFMLHSCRTSVKQLIDGRGSAGIRFISVMNAGGGSWYVVTSMTSPSLELKATLRDGVLTLSGAPVTPAARQVVGAPAPISALLGGTIPAEPPPEPAAVVMFLRGEALAPSQAVEEFNPILPVFSSGEEQEGWPAVLQTHQQWLDAADGSDRGTALLQLGKSYLDIGFHRDAAYYFRQLDADPADQPRWLVQLALARAYLGYRNWDEARRVLAAAAAAGAPENLLLEQLGLISRATGSPPRAATGRALAGSTLRPEARLLAAELLQMDDVFGESLAVLGIPPPDLDPVTLEGWHLRTGDALLATGDVEGARLAYNQMAGDLAIARSLVAEANSRPPTRWPEMLPKLMDRTLDRDRSSAEALYLVANIEQEVWDVPGALEHLGEIARRFPELARGSDVLATIWSLYKVRVLELANAEQWFDVAVVHRSTWSPGLAEVVRDPSPLEHVAVAYENLGLPDQALRVLNDAFQVLIREDSKDPALPFHLARLLASNGQDEDALATLEWLQAHGIPPHLRGEKALLAAGIYEKRGDLDAAVRELRAAAQVPETREQAQLQWALLDAHRGRCKEAITQLWLQLMPEQRRARDLPSEPYLTLANCLMTEGRYPEAAEVAREAARRAAEPGLEASATAIATAAEQAPATTPADPTKPPVEAGIWSRVARENTEAEDFARLVERYK